MRNETYEILLRCYGDAREGFCIIKNGIVHYANRALIRMAGQDISGKHVDEVFPSAFTDGIDRAFSKKENAYLECADIFGRHTDVRAFKHKGMTVLVFSDLDDLAQELRKNEESFKILKSAHRQLTDSITAVESAAELMVKSMTADISDQTMGWLKAINTGVGNMSGALMDIVEVIDRREENADKGCRVEDLTACINRVAESMSRRFELRGVRLEVTSSPERVVFAFNPKSVTHMVLRLLERELEDALEGDTVHLHTQGFENRVEITAGDMSKSVESEHMEFLENPQVEDMDRIFSKYGNSLYLVRRIAMFYDGSVHIDNEDRGKKITVKLPKAQVEPHVQQGIQPIKSKSGKARWELI